MIEREKIDKLNELADSLSLPGSEIFLGRDVPPFDISRPNLHATRAEFKAEFEKVSAALERVDGLLELLRELDPERNLENASLLERIRGAVNLEIRNGTRKMKIREGRSRDLVVQNFRDTGFFENFITVLTDKELGLMRRQRELQDQEALFWQGHHRSQNPYPYAIAHRFARFYREQTGKLPKFGISSQGRHPSTDFGLALERCFSTLEIKVSLKGPAKSAVEAVAKEQSEKRRDRAPRFSMGLHPDFFAPSQTIKDTASEGGKEQD